MSATPRKVNGRNRKVNPPERTTTRTRKAKPGPAFNPEAISPEAAVFHPVTQDEISDRAYHLYLARGRRHGDDLADWFRAEAELRRERGIQVTERSGTA